MKSKRNEADPENVEDNKSQAINHSIAKGSKNKTRNDDWNNER